MLNILHTGAYKLNQVTKTAIQFGSNDRKEEAAWRRAKLPSDMRETYRTVPTSDLERKASELGKEYENARYTPEDADSPEVQMKKKSTRLRASMESQTIKEILDGRKQ